MILQVDPLDTVFFRDGRPFARGSETWAEALFPPSPGVFYGALRGHYFSRNLGQLGLAGDLNNDPTLKSLRIDGVYLEKEGMPLFPLPLELVKAKDVEENLAFCREKRAGNEVLSNAPVANISYTSRELEEVQGYITLFHLKEYLLAGTNASIPFIPASQLLTIEPKIGIRRANAIKTVEEGNLYRIPMHRLAVGRNRASLSFLLDTNYDQLDEIPSLLRLGGEGKIAKCQAYPDAVVLPKPKAVGKFFKLYFLTPAIFLSLVKQASNNQSKGGWLPSCFSNDNDENVWIGKWKGITLKLLDAYVGKPLYIGGFDARKGQPKTMYRAIPPGSVYHFEILDGSGTEDIIGKFSSPGNPLSDIREEEGFGLALVGNLNPNME